MPAGEHCENCGRVIGRLETPYVWRKHTVCAACHAHLTAPAAAAAVNPRPIGGAPPLPAPQHYHARTMPPAPHAPSPAPIALQPPAPAVHAPSMFLCTGCGQSYPVADVVSDQGKLVCRACAMAAAAERARMAAHEKRQSNLFQTLVAAAAVVVIGGLAFGAWMVIGSRKGADVVSTARSGPAANQPPAPQPTPAPAPASDRFLEPDTTAVAPEPDAKSLFPNVSDTGTADADRPAADAPQAADPSGPAATADFLPAQPPASPDPLALQQTPGPQTPAPSRDSSAVPAAAAAATPAVPAPAPAPPPPQGTAAWHVYQGKALLAQGKSQPALEQFAAAMKMDRNNADAVHGAGLCYQNMGDRKLAIERLEKANTLYQPPSRAAVFNLGVMLVRENPTRATKLIMEYLANEAAPPDEPLHNLMGKALFSVNRQGQKNRVFGEVEAFYYAYNGRLESGRTDGRLRWGSEWVPARDANEKWSRYKTRKQNAERLRNEVAQATKRKEDAWSKVYDMRTGMRLYTDQEKVTTNKRYEEAAKNEIAIRQQLKTAETEFNSTEKPPMPQLIKTVPMDATIPSAR
jgi:tetratricopeptide (TPR) repeat protein